MRPQALRDDARLGDGSSLRDSELGAAFADVWRAVPLDATEMDVAIGGAALAIPLVLVDTRTFGSRVIYERYRRRHARQPSRER